jgi:two-component system response regulator (stage 0 sporulation protein A)
MKNKPQIIIVTALGQEKVSRIAIELGADFFMIKPVDLDELVYNIKHLYSLKNFREIVARLPDPPKAAGAAYESRIRNLLNIAGVPAHLKGYDYIVLAVQIIMEDLSAINAMKKQVYSRISRQFNTTPARVERAIRNAIELTWNRGNIDILEKLFGFDESGEKSRPSNSEFFIKLATEILEKRGAESTRNMR